MKQSSDSTRGVGIQRCSRNDPRRKLCSDNTLSLRRPDSVTLKFGTGTQCFRDILAKPMDKYFPQQNYNTLGRECARIALR